MWDLQATSFTEAPQPVHHPRTLSHPLGGSRGAAADSKQNKEQQQKAQLPARPAPATPRRPCADAQGAGHSRLASRRPLPEGDFFQGAGPAGRCFRRLLPEGCGRGRGGGALPACSAARLRPRVLNRAPGRLGACCGGAMMGAPSLPPTWQLYLKDHRISTFKNWPFLEDCSCTPERVSRPLLAPQRPHTDFSVPASSDSTLGLTVP